MPKSTVLSLLLIALMAAVPSFTLAGPAPNPVYRSLESGKTAHDAGVVRGVIESVDYSGGMISLRARSRDIIAIAVIPSTAIYRRKQYGTFSDLRRGQSVEISVYEVDGRLVAQTIRLK
ncbi:MAG: hypothetical protein M3R51_07300 [Candidatus Eremiobacteraeota bacterium]|nr:hypothetical protein [Candidatus Eremiobacteraeota bacterium]